MGLTGSLQGGWHWGSVTGGAGYWYSRSFIPEMEGGDERGEVYVLERGSW